MALLSFHRPPLFPEDSVFDDAPVRYVLVALWHGGRLLMVYVRERGCWELPGGGIEPGERPRAAAVRELREETGQAVGERELRFVGHSRTALGADQRTLYGAVFTGECAAPVPFVPNREISAAHWRLGAEPLPGGGEVQTVDEYVAALCGSTPG
jgi:8-oxo-dGTP pyrophosphatase MutT (NUDIX family)